MKTRTQIQLDPQDHARVKAFAARRRLSMSAAIRMLLRQSLGQEDAAPDERWNAFLAAAGSARDRQKLTDVARYHDRYLFEDPV